MSMLHPAFLDAIAIPKKQLPLYYFLRGLLFIAFFSITTIIGYSFLFPSQSFSFDFRNPDAAKNTLLDPRDADGTPERKGKVEKQGVLTLNNGALGIFSNATVSVQLKKDSTLPDDITLTAQKGYREIFLPEGAPAEFPSWRNPSTENTDAYESVDLFRVDGNIYQRSGAMLYRFTSEAAALSRYEPGDIADEDTAFLSYYPISDEWIGFRPGTLLSFADGVFVVYSETDIRPIGSAEIFQSIGYHWEDVIPASEEEISIYKRGKIILPGTLHAEGTLFYDTDTTTYFTIDGADHRRPIIDPSLLSFFLRHTHAISVSEQSLHQSSSCTLRPGNIFTHEYTCTLQVKSLSDITGDGYQFSLQSKEAIDIDSIDITLNRSPEKGNFRSTLSQLKARLLDRYASR